MDATYNEITNAEDEVENEETKETKQGSAPLGIGYLAYIVTG